MLHYTYIYIYIERERDMKCVHIHTCVCIYIYIYTLSPEATNATTSLNSPFAHRWGQLLLAKYCVLLYFSVDIRTRTSLQVAAHFNVETETHCTMQVAYFNVEIKTRNVWNVPFVDGWATVFAMRPFSWWRFWKVWSRLWASLSRDSQPSLKTSCLPQFSPESRLWNLHHEKINEEHGRTYWLRIFVFHCSSSYSQPCKLKAPNFKGTVSNPRTIAQHNLEVHFDNSKLLSHQNYEASWYGLADWTVSD